MLLDSGSNSSPSPNTAWGYGDCLDVSGSTGQRFRDYVGEEILQSVGLYEFGTGTDAPQLCTYCFLPGYYRSSAWLPDLLLTVSYFKLRP